MTSIVQGALAPITGNQVGNIGRGAQSGSSGFSDTLANAIDQVEQLHQDAQSQVQQALAGDGQDLHTAIIAVEKADIAFQLMMQVRNKIVNAYQEVSRMQF
jgi:flagellar hook-basal body complex protein FliE